MLYLYKDKYKDLYMSVYVFMCFIFICQKNK